jgi:hypothetical protein
MKPTLKPKRRDGFALVVTISMMVLLTIIVVATLSLSAVTLRAVDKDSAQAVARANARMALMIAIGHLQKEAGPDQRVTATAEIEGDNQNPYWTGVWKAGKNAGDSKPVWLVSGNNPDPDKALDDVNSAVLVKPLKSQDAKKEVRAPYVEVKGRQLDGRFAYWIGDEGTKVRVDVANPEDKSSIGPRERIGRSQSPQEPGFSAFDSDHRKTWAGFDSDYAGAIDRKSLVSMGTVALAAKPSGNLKREDIPKYYFNDLTTGGFGLPVNVRDGGMKKDLSLILDSSSSSTSFAKPFVTKFLGASPGRATRTGVVPGTVVYGFENPDKARFTLSPTITNSYGGGFVGPNWGTLFNYARLWETVSGNTTPMVGMYPRVDSDLRQSKWPPYREFAKGDDYREDLQHVNSGLSPMMSMAQMGFYLKTEPVGVDQNTQMPFYKVSVLMKPIVGLWNPYNVHIQDAFYQLEWAIAPVLDIESNLTAEKEARVGGRVYKSQPEQRVWLRDYWGAQDGGAVFPIDGNQGGSYFRLRTQQVNFQPGEFRLFSVRGATTLQENNDIVATLDVTGAYTIDVYSYGLTALNKSFTLGYPAGTRISVPRATLQDTHPRFATAVRNKFKGIDMEAASTWFTLKAGTAKGSYSTHLNRYTDLWNGGKGGLAAQTIPENVISAKQTYVVDALTAPQHIATWRFYTRNSTEASGGQGLRGWVDANPRVMSNNFRMDGSRNQPGDFQGWNVSSNLIGGRSDPAFGDGQGGSRGLVAEGGNVAQIIPQGPGGESGRWQGLTGPASTFAEGGLTHVVIYDVPQAPLTSIGQFQHANLSRYPFEPGFVIGNSYANPRVPLNSIVNPNFGSLGFQVVDTAYEANQRIWDTVFFSTLAPDYKGGGSSFDQAFDRNALILRTKALPNPRMVYTEIPGDTSIDKVIEQAGVNAPQTIATRIMIEGAFNVNSTSKTAWKAILSTMDGSELPVISKTSQRSEPDWVVPKGIRFSRFNHPILDGGYRGGGRDAAFWQGWRELSDEELDALAEAIVDEVKDRGPFRSMADFVNRNPYSNKTAHQYKGALQAAIDNSVNKSIGSSVGAPASDPPGSSFSKVTSGESQAAGHAAYLLQGDVLQCLAPIMQVRSDYFRIRTCGEALDKAGKVVARVWCEAFVQRRPEYVDPADAPEAPFDDPKPSDLDAKEDLRSEVNKTFGRRMQLISFRWLNPTEI